MRAALWALLVWASPAIWLLALLAIGVVADLFRRVVKRERIQSATASDELWVRSLDEYRERVRLGSLKRPGA